MAQASRASKNLIYSKGKSSAAMPYIKDGVLRNGDTRVKGYYPGMPNILDTSKGDFPKRGKRTS